MEIMPNPDDGFDISLECTDMASIPAISSNDIDSIYETLQEPFEDMERRILVSSLVQDAVSRGFLKALEEDFRSQLASRDGVIRCLEDLMLEKDTEIILMNYVQEVTHENVTSYLIELESKADTEAMIIRVLLECWYQQVENLFDSHASHHTRKLEIDEILASERLQYNIVLNIVLEILSQKFQEALLVGDSRCKICTHNGSTEKTIRNDFGELEAQIESLLEFEACKLEMIQYGCSTSIARCELKLETLMENLANQVNEMRTKITLVQEAIKQQEWKHMVEQDILSALLWDKISEMNKRLCLQNHEQMRDAPIRLFDDLSDLKGTLEIKDVRDSAENIEFLSLKNSLEDVRKEKAAVEQKLEERTEELYSLKRQFWKEREFWVSKLSQPLIKEFEAQIEDLPKHSSVILDLEEEYKKLEKIRYDSMIDELKKEWSIERESLLQSISEKEAEIEKMLTQLMSLTEKDKTSTTTTASLFACVTDLNVQVDKLSAENLKKDIDFIKCEQEWHAEKKSMEVELDRLLAKEQTYSAKEHILLDRISELEKEIKKLQSDQQSLMKLKEEWEVERVKKVSEEEDMVSRMVSLSQREEINRNHIEQLKAERDELKVIQDQNEKFVKSLMEEREIAQSLLIKERDDEKRMRKTLESELEEMKLELESLHRQSSDQNEKFVKSLIEEREIAQSLLIKERDDEKRMRKTLESELEEMKLELESLHRQSADQNEKLVKSLMEERDDEKRMRKTLESELEEMKLELESLHRQSADQGHYKPRFDLGSDFEGQVDKSSKGLYEFRQRIIHAMEEKSERSECVDVVCQLIKNYIKPFTCKEAHYKQKLAKELYNLQKAETEVDLLGDEVESLLVVLEEVQTTFDLYAPILQHYPKMSQVAALVKREVQLRIDPKYGT